MHQFRWRSHQFPLVQHQCFRIVGHNKNPPEVWLEQTFVPPSATATSEVWPAQTIVPLVTSDVQIACTTVPSATTLQQWPTGITPKNSLNHTTPSHHQHGLHYISSAGSSAPPIAHTSAFSTLSSNYKQQNQAKSSTMSSILQPGKSKPPPI